MREIANAALIAALAARAPLSSADLFTFTLRDGSTFRVTGADRDVTWSGTTWSAAGPTIQRSTWSVKNTTEVPEMTIRIFTDGTDFEPGNLKRLVHDGYFDGAYVELSRAFMPTFGDTSLGTVLLFGGRAGKAEITALGITLTCTASNVILAQNIPRNTYQLGCIHTLYDTGCTLSKWAHTATFTVQAATAITLVSAEPMPNGGNYVLGTTSIIDGVGVGQSRTIEAWDTVGQQAVQVSYPLLTVPQPGDHFTLSEGCDKTRARCDQFGNLVNFRGFPNIPPAELGL
jgi:uncharacterized phage protein (TIGR02218 family)